MKYNLTILELTAKQMVDIMNRLDTDVQVHTTRPDNIIQLPALGSAEAIAAVVNQNAAGSTITDEDVDAIMNDSTSELLKSAGGADVDSEGMKWDGRIHSGSKKKNADGRWKLLKNVDPALVASVKAGNNLPAFLQKMPAAAPVTAPVISAAPVAAPAPIMTQPQPAPTRDFSGLMLKISSLFANKQITPDYPATIVNRINTGFANLGLKIATLTDVANDPRMVEYAWQCLDVDGKAA